MSYEFRMPSVSGTTAEEQLRQMQSFLRQHVQELNFVMQRLEGALSEAQVKQVQDLIEKNGRE